MAERRRDMNLLEEIRAYVPWNEQEEIDRERMIAFLESGEDIWTRNNETAHMTASAWVVSPDQKKVLMAYHNIYDSWSWLGGHADGEKDLLSVCLREVKEEAGVKNVRPVSDRIYSIEILTVDGHVKKGKYVGSHLHINVTYLLEADPAEAVHEKPDENSGVAWFEKDAAIAASSEPWFRKHVYSKLNAKLKLSE